MKEKTLSYQLLLVLMVLVWGLTFPLSKIGLYEIDVMPMLTLRFGLGTVTLFLVIFLRDRKKGRLWRTIFDPVALRGGLLVGVVAGVGMILQVGAMTYTSAAKSAFITGLHVILIPIFGAAFFRVKFDRLSCVGLAGAVVGLVLFNGILRFDGGPHFGFEELNLGDFMTLGCAVCFAVQLNLINRYNRRCDVLALTGWQVLVTALMPGIIWAVFQPEARCELGQPEILLILFVIGPLAAGIFLAVQVFVQTKIAVTRAALIYSLEPVFGALFAAVIPDRTGAVEQITPPMVLGGAIMLLSITVVQMIHGRRERLAAEE